MCVYDVFGVLVGWKQFIFWSFDPNFSKESIRVGCDNEKFTETVVETVILRHRYMFYTAIQRGNQNLCSFMMSLWDTLGISLGLTRFVSRYYMAVNGSPIWKEVLQELVRFYEHWMSVVSTQFLTTPNVSPNINTWKKRFFTSWDIQKHQQLFLVPLIGGRWYIITQ